MDHPHNQRNISPTMFLHEVMWAEDVEMANRVAAANALTHWTEAGDFREADIRYVIPEQELQ